MLEEQTNMIARDLKIIENLLRRPVDERDCLLVEQTSSPTMRKYYIQSFRSTIIISTNKIRCAKELTGKSEPVVHTIAFGKVIYYAAIE